jgi:hypothetical protein
MLGKAPVGVQAPGADLSTGLSTSRLQKGHAVLRTTLPARQQGAVIITVALALLFLLGFMGIALDFGRLFIVKTELQTAMDSCALAAAQELDGSADAMGRASRAGQTAANLNRVHFQAYPAGLQPQGVVFSDLLDGTYSPSFTPAASARYARCSHSTAGLAPLLLQTMGAFTGNADFAKTQTVGAVAVAARVSAQTNCLLPVGVCQQPGGFVRGEWLSGVTRQNDEMATSGQFRWLDFSANGGGTREIKDLLAGNGQCNLPGTNTKVSDVGKSGGSNGASAAWNTRFGIYQGSYTANTSTPDFTGYSWYVNSPNAPASLRGRYDDTANGYPHHRGLNSPYQGNDKNLKVEGSPSTRQVHEAGSSRRVVTVAVVDCASTSMDVKEFACMLMLHPLPKNASTATTKMWLEYISDATAVTGNPCVSTGLPGAGAGGVRVPALVR